MAARNRWLASYNAIVSLEVYCKIYSRLMLSLQNSAYPMPLYTALNNKKEKKETA